MYVVVLILLSFEGFMIYLPERYHWFWPILMHKEGGNGGRAGGGRGRGDGGAGAPGAEFFFFTVFFSKRKRSCNSNYWTQLAEKYKLGMCNSHMPISLPNSMKGY